MCSVAVARLVDDAIVLHHVHVDGLLRRRAAEAADSKEAGVGGMLVQAILVDELSAKRHLWRCAGGLSTRAQPSLASRFNWVP